MVSSLEEGFNVAIAHYVMCFYVYSSTCTRYCIGLQACPENNMIKVRTCFGNLWKYLQWKFFYFLCSHYHCP